jgi:hypothetical protein
MKTNLMVVWLAETKFGRQLEVNVTVPFNGGDPHALAEFCAQNQARAFGYLFIQVTKARIVPDLRRQDPELSWPRVWAAGTVLAISSLILGSCDAGVYPLRATLIDGLGIVGVFVAVTLLANCHKQKKGHT